MGPQFRLKLQFANATLVAVLTIAGSAVAQTLPKQGSYDWTSCWSGAANAIQYSKTHWGMSFQMTGTILSNPPGTVFDRNTFRCVGMQASLGGKISGSNLCEAIDLDGDTRLANYSFTSSGKVIKDWVAGTGKYEGMQMRSTVLDLGPFPTIVPGTFQGCNHETGTYKLK
jgi:hypothetical protein